METKSPQRSHAYPSRRSVPAVRRAGNTQTVTRAVITVTVVCILSILSTYSGQLTHPTRQYVKPSGSPWFSGGPGAVGATSSYLQSVTLKDGAQKAPVPVDPAARDEVMSGIYEARSPWLHDGYAHGFKKWRAEGQYEGVSADKSLVILREGRGESRGDLVARILLTGDEQWRLKGAPTQCARAIQGIAYCVDTTGENTLALVSIDYRNGVVTNLAEVSQGAVVRPELIGEQNGQSIWVLPFSMTKGKEITELVALKNGSVTWQVPIIHGAKCHSADSVIACESRSNENRATLEVFSTISGKKVSQFDNAQAVFLFRDGVVIGRDGQKYKKYSWTGENLGTLSAAPSIRTMWPGPEEGVLPPLRSLDYADARVMNSLGEPLVRGPRNHEQHPYVDISTGRGIGQKGDSLRITASESGKFYLVTDLNGGQTRAYEESGKQSFPLGYSNRAYYSYEDGIIYRQSGDLNEAHEVVIYVPKGMLQ